MDEKSKLLLSELKRKGLDTQSPPALKIFVQDLKGTRNTTKTGRLPPDSEKFKLELFFPGIDLKNASEVTQKINDLFDELKKVAEDDSYAYLKDVLD